MFLLDERYRDMLGVEESALADVLAEVGALPQHVPAAEGVRRLLEQMGAP